MAGAQRKAVTFLLREPLPSGALQAAAAICGNGSAVRSDAPELTIDRWVAR
jgi:hypothetical protein